MFSYSIAFKKKICVKNWLEKQEDWKYKFIEYYNILKRDGISQNKDHTSHKPPGPPKVKICRWDPKLSR